MLFQIVQIAPTYNFSDAIVGSHIVSRSHAYVTKALAFKLAALRAQESYENCGDDNFVVVRAGGSPWQHADVVTEEPLESDGCEPRDPYWSNDGFGSSELDCE
jgi:hypothetical protein